MSYDHAALAAFVLAKLAESPQITLVGLCRELQIDRHTLAQALSESTGQTFRQLKNQLVTEAVEIALAHGVSKSIKQAASEVGYQSASSFAKKIRRATGMTPVALRRRKLS